MKKINSLSTVRASSIKAKTTTRIQHTILSICGGLVLYFLLVGQIKSETLNDAVAAQLIQNCDLLRTNVAGGLDPLSVTVGGLNDICSDAANSGAAQGAGGGSTNSTSVSNQAKKVMQAVRNQSQDGETAQDSNITTVGLSSAWTLFFTLELEKLDRDVTSMEDGFDSNATRLIAGTNYVINSDFDIGFVLTREGRDGDYTGGGNFDSELTGVRILASYFPDQNSFVQVLAGIDTVSMDRIRNPVYRALDPNDSDIINYEVTNATPQAGYDVDQQELSISGGYNYSFDNFTLSPQIGLTWLSVDYGTYTEAGASGLELTFYDDKRESLQSSIGATGSMTISTSEGVMIPQLGVYWKKEYDDKNRKANVSFVGDTRAKQFSYDVEGGDDSYFELSAGMAFIHPGGAQSFIRFQTLLSHDYYDSYVVSTGMNFEL